MRTDRGDQEYYSRYTEDWQASSPFVKFLQENRIVFQYTMPSSPDQNGIIERRNRTLMDMRWSMLSSSKLSRTLWTEVLETTVYIKPSSNQHCPYDTFWVIQRLEIEFVTHTRMKMPV